MAVTPPERLWQMARSVTRDSRVRYKVFEGIKDFLLPTGYSWYMEIGGHIGLCVSDNQHTL
ncbi:hypothetical protein N7462_000731 [Penicillium macrosclerotiorum]|uniref:uncharacterized protein n=1 Tax=Penicillium macrosclerotiorum TaxID=303699 RepID=UPI00254841A8|nr:uncharacterized protein N7462_000731 [Penicillium macrosclerotiorum]KAJ5698726.1 hypothetical protein N7462_000731 [Penicillium macrosclerotiorum]